jgi:prepilin signal peptidase PulO-like enzyme (type II secretory pathway)
MVVADLETCLIPDEIHWALLPLGIAFHFLMQSDFIQMLKTALTGLSLGLLLHYGYHWLRGKHGLGLGDVKFLAVAGLWLGTLHHLVVFIFYSGLIGVIIGVIWRFATKEERFPFGPALAVSLFMLTIYPETGNWFWQTLRQLLVH